MNARIKIKPLSVNRCWQGRRFKTKEYIEYEKEMMLMLPKCKMEKGVPLCVRITLWIDQRADIDNPIKPILDILQKKYGFNDRDIMTLTVNKIVQKSKKDNYIEIEIC
ncbi:MAG: RusA family crossover junction endodeoxyribonuclease [Patescibacteria group bacterium]|nr:RusA family crossover junction endodeoxyribonuclease [Patescibacteria group bacterium]